MSTLFVNGWCRLIEMLLGAWLIAAPFVVGYAAADRQGPMWTDLICGGLVLLLAAVSVAGLYRPAHYYELLPAAWLTGHGYFLTDPEFFIASQSQILVGLTLLMFAILPNRAVDPPQQWSRFAAERYQAEG